MDTIISGNREVLKRYKFFKCDNCGWVGRAAYGEYKMGDQREPGCWVNCPVCGTCADEVNDAVKVAEYSLMLKRKQEQNDDDWFRRGY